MNGGEWATYYVLSDPQDNVAALATADGTLVAEYDYDPYGRLIRETGPKAASCPFRYSSKYRDPDLELYYYGHRWYDAAGMKWLTPDPIGERGGANLTAFCDGDPINQVDPLGLRSQLYQWVDPETGIIFYRFADTYDVYYLGFERAVVRGETLPRMLFDAPLADLPLQVFQGESIRMVMGEGMGNAVNGIVEIAPLMLGTAGNVAEGIVGVLLIVSPEATGLTKVGGGLLIADAIDRQQAMFRFEPTIFEQLCSTYMSGDEVRHANMVKDGGMMVLTLGAIGPGAKDPVSQLAAQGYLRIMKGSKWQSYYDSFAAGTTRLKVNLGRRRVLFRQHNTMDAIRYGEFAATSEALSPVDAIIRNALHPRITGGNRARIQCKVTPTRRFYIYVEGEVASQGGAFIGGNEQNLILRSGAKPVFEIIDLIPYKGSLP